MLVKVLHLLRVRHELAEAVGTVETAVPAQRDASAKTNPCGGKPSPDCKAKWRQSGAMTGSLNVIAG